MAVWKCPKCQGVFIVSQGRVDIVQRPRCGMRCEGLMQIVVGDRTSTERMVWRAMDRALEGFENES